MTMQAHLDSLAQKRAWIKTQIATESAHPSADFARIKELKKQNLALKEEMQHCLIELRQGKKSAG